MPESAPKPGALASVPQFHSEDSLTTVQNTVQKEALPRARPP